MSIRRVLVSLGSSLAPEQNLPAAVALLARCPGIVITATSGVFESPPLERPGDPWFHNAALALQTTLNLEALRAEFRRLEAALGRVRGGDPYGPRTIDIDLVAAEDFEGEVGGKPLPDPDIARRAFLALPLAEVAPDWVLGTPGRTLAEIAASFDAEAEGIRRLPGSLLPA
jgi:2-amino-4-hydroxy-6-hydroxymethyldihydropteridine diphosphokinase